MLLPHERYCGHGGSPHRRSAPHHGDGELHRRREAPGDAARRLRARRRRPRHDHRHRHERGEVRARRRRGVHRRGSRHEGPVRRGADGPADPGGDEAPPGARLRPRALHRRADRRRGRRDARAGGRRRRARDVDVRPARRGRRPDQGARRRRADSCSPIGNLAAAGPARRGRARRRRGASSRARFINQRLAAVPMEPGAALAAPDPETGGLHPVDAEPGRRTPTRAAIAAARASSRTQLRVDRDRPPAAASARASPCYPEQVVVGRARAQARHAPVRYVETRSETMLAMQHGRAQVQDVEIGGTRDGTITGLKVRVIADCGAYPADAALMPMLTGLMSLRRLRHPEGRLPRSDCVVTNTTPIGAYRGAGRPEATALVERAIDMFAAEIGHGPGRGAAKNFIAPTTSRTRPSRGANYDSGEYRRGARQGARERRLRAAARRAGGAPRARRRQAARHRPVQLRRVDRLRLRARHLRGRARTARSPCRAARPRTARATRRPTRSSSRATLGVDARGRARSSSPTPKLVARGMGTMGSRSLQVGGSAVHQRHRRGARQGPAARRAPARGRRGRHRGRPRQGPRRRGLAGHRRSPWAQLAAAARRTAPEGIEPAA